jgi:hypothetical protein
MHISKLIKPVFITLVAGGVISMTTSSAVAATGILPAVSGTVFTGKTGKLTLQIKGGLTITCTSSTTTGEVVSTSKLLILTIGKSCTTVGLPVNSLSDASGQILIHVEAPPCVGLGLPPSISITLEFLELHLEVPAVGLLFVTRGAAVAPVVPDNTSVRRFTLSPSQKGGEQSVTKCQGGPARTLETSADSGSFVQTGLEAAEDTLEFGTEEEFMT